MVYYNRLICYVIIIIENFGIFDNGLEMSVFYELLGYLIMGIFIKI